MNTASRSVNTGAMATWEDVARLALALPEASEGQSYGNASWQVRGKGFVWERPLRKSDLTRLDRTARFDAQVLTDTPILAVYVDDLAEKEAVLAAYPAFSFTIAHFDNFPAVLVLLDRIDTGRLEELVVDAWLVRAPKRLAAEYLAENPRR